MGRYWQVLGGGRSKDATSLRTWRDENRFVPQFRDTAKWAGENSAVGWRWRSWRGADVKRFA